MLRSKPLRVRESSRGAGPVRGCELELLDRARNGGNRARIRYSVPPPRDDMTHVIAQPCINVKDKACVDVCPVDCIHGGDGDPQLFINPNDCIDCTLCVDACPVRAIFAEEDLPQEWKEFAQKNRDHYA
jgi:ferredoxin